MRIAIRGVGVVGGFGCGTEALYMAISKGKSDIEHVQVKTSEGPRSMPALTADTTGLDNFVSKRALRRVDHYSRLALLGAYLALADTGSFQKDMSRTGVIIASGYGPCRTTLAFLDTFINDGDNLSSPTYFSNSVQNAAVANISMMLDITGPGLTVSQFEMSVPSALITARKWLEEKRVDAVLFGAVDEYYDLLGYFWYRFYGRNATDDHEVKPFIYGLQTAVPGEGAAFFLLTRDDENAPGYGYIEDVVMGRCGRSPLITADNTYLFIGADGHKKCGTYYEDYIPENAGLAAYAPIYGSLPVGTAFDVAIGAMSMKSGRVFYNSSEPQTENRYDEVSLDDKKIGCLKIDSSGALGLISLCRK
jgi:3-oxoacyl-[acyl-carrier-protein] synthase II